MGSSRQKTYKTLFAILGCLIFAYSVIKIFPLVRGPQIFVEGINNGENHGPIAFISGKTKNVRELTLNNNKIMLDEKGNWSDTLLLHGGYNILSFVAKDNFGRTKIEKFEITADKFAFSDEEILEEKEINEGTESIVLGAESTIQAEIEYENLQNNEEI